MAREMAEQPDSLRRLVARTEQFAGPVREARLAARPDGGAPQGVMIVARGSSDHAGTYGRYLLEHACGRPVSLAAPSLYTHYGVRPDLRGIVAIAVSQSGRTPEIVATLRAMRAAGAGTIAITNDADSELAHEGDGVVDLDVGEERAVPATKTVTATMAAFAALAPHFGAVGFDADELGAVPGWVAQVLDDPEPADAAAEMLVGAAHLIVVARGFLYGAAMESALKIKETCSLLADGYSSADLRHGPIAAVTRDFPVIALSVPGPTAPDIAELVGQLRQRGARVLTVGGDAESDVPLPEGMPESLAPIVAVVRGQQIAHALALHLGRDPDAPPGLNKVTAT